MNEIERDFRTQSQHLLWSVWRGLLVGVAAGAVVSLFRWLIAKGAQISVSIYQDALNHPVLILGIVLVNLILAILIGYLIKQEKDIKGSGIPHVEGELMGLLHPSWWSVLWRKFLGGVLGISMGLLLGREGPSIQLGAMTAKGLSKGLKLSARDQRVLIAAGAAAGLSAAFNAPIAGLLFVVEEVYHHFSRHVWVTALTASLVANAVSLRIFGQVPVLAMTEKLPVFPLKDYWILIVLGIFLGVLGYGYEWVVLRIGKVYQVLGKIFHLPSYFHGLLAVLFIVPIGLYFPHLLGGGNELILALNGLHPALTVAIIYLAIRFVWSMLSFGSGFPGGIFLPILTLGALSGSVFAAAFENLGFLQVSQFPIFIILGMAGYFGAVSKAPLTAMILVTEMVGDLHQLMTIGVVTLIAYLVMDFMGGEPVYEAMLHNLIAHEPKQVDNIPTMIDLPVTDSLAGRLVKDLTLPDGVLISTQIFQDQSEVVHGDTRLKAGATLYLVVNESNISQVRKLFL